MNKSQLIDAITNDTGLTKIQSGKAVESILANIAGSLKKGEEVSLTGFGAFKVSERAARAGRNPKTGEAIEIAARKSPSFTAGKSLKEAVQ